MVIIRCYIIAGNYKIVECTNPNNNLKYYEILKFEISPMKWKWRDEQPTLEDAIKRAKTLRDYDREEREKNRTIRKTVKIIKK